MIVIIITDLPTEKTNNFVLVTQITLYNLYILHTTPDPFPISSHDSITNCANVIISHQYMYILCLNDDLVLNYLTHQDLLKCMSYSRQIACDVDNLMLYLQFHCEYG